MRIRHRFVQPGFVQKPVPGRQAAQLFSSDFEDQASFGYLLYLPETYGNPKEKHPLILFLHGASERGEDVSIVKRHGLPKRVENAPDFPFILLSPQCPRFHWWVDGQQQRLLIHLLDDVMASYDVDADRVYVTGISMGGFGTWKLAAAHPERFAAAVPICGGGDPDDAPRVAEMPLWAFHGAADYIVPWERSQAMIAAVEQAGGHPRFTLDPKAGHDVWTAAYDRSELYDWLLSHRLSHRQQVGATVQELTD
jgi:predicted peptidase